jgi:hypothetical protein
MAVKVRVKPKRPSWAPDDGRKLVLLARLGVGGAEDAGAVHHDDR